MVKKTVKKVVLLGESAVGKTSLIRRFVHDEFSDSYISTIGTKVSKKVLDINFEGQDTQVNLMIWDMLGREGYMSTQARQIVGAQGVIIVADITRPETLTNLEKYWIPLILRTIGTVKLPFVFLGNKVDLADGDALTGALDLMNDLETRYNHGMKQYIPEHLNIILYRLLQEALNNVVKHSRASFVRVLLAKTGNGIEVSVEDDGQGFHVDQCISAETERHCYGLEAMRERVEFSGGAFSIWSTKGRGTSIRAFWPL